MSRLLTEKKQAWANQFKPNVLRGNPLSPNMSDALRYQKRLHQLIKRMTTDVEKQLKELFNTDYAKQYFAQDASISSQARILTNSLMRKYEEMFSIFSKPMSEKVVEEAEKSSSTALELSIEQLSGGLTIKISSISDYTKQILDASITENVALIKSIPEKYLNGVQQAVMRSITSGQGLKDLVPYLQKHAGITNRRANLIALDQTRKAFNAISRGKMEKLGLQNFEWLHSGGSNHPRKLHQKLSGKIFSLDNPPIIEQNGTTEIRGFPGQLPYCRCKMMPVIKFDEE